MRRPFSSFVGVALGTSGVLIRAVVEADQAAWISKKEADAGAALIVVGQELRGYCQPCGDGA